MENILWGFPEDYKTEQNTWVDAINTCIDNHSNIMFLQNYILTNDDTILINGKNHINIEGNNFYLYRDGIDNIDNNFIKIIDCNYIYINNLQLKSNQTSYPLTKDGTTLLNDESKYSNFLGIEQDTIIELGKASNVNGLYLKKCKNIYLNNFYTQYLNNSIEIDENCSEIFLTDINLENNRSGIKINGVKNFSLQNFSISLDSINTFNKFYAIELLNNINHCHIIDGKISYMNKLHSFKYDEEEYKNISPLIKITTSQINEENINEGKNIFFKNIEMISEEFFEIESTIENPKINFENCIFTTWYPEVQIAHPTGQFNANCLIKFDNCQFNLGTNGIPFVNNNIFIFNECNIKGEIKGKIIPISNYVLNKRLNSSAKEQNSTGSIIIKNILFQKNTCKNLNVWNGFFNTVPYSNINLSSYIIGYTGNISKGAQRGDSLVVNNNNIYTKINLNQYYDASKNLINDYWLDETCEYLNLNLYIKNWEGTNGANRTTLSNENYLSDLILTYNDDMVYIDNLLNATAGAYFYNSTINYPAIFQERDDTSLPIHFYYSTLNGGNPNRPIIKQINSNNNPVIFNNVFVENSYLLLLNENIEYDIQINNTTYLSNLTNSPKNYWMGIDFTQESNKNEYNAITNLTSITTEQILQTETYLKNQKLNEYIKNNIQCKNSTFDGNFLDLSEGILSNNEIELI